MTLPYKFLTQTFFNVLTAKNQNLIQRNGENTLNFTINLFRYAFSEMGYALISKSIARGDLINSNYRSNYYNLLSIHSISISYPTIICKEIFFN